MKKLIALSVFALTLESGIPTDETVTFGPPEVKADVYCWQTEYGYWLCDWDWIPGAIDGG